MIYIVCGIAGIGKSTYINSIKNDNDIVISRDAIRFSLLKEGEDYFSKEKQVLAIFFKTIRKETAKDDNAAYNIYIDATHLTKKARRKVINNISNKNKDKVACIYFNPDLKKALSNELINRIYCDSDGNCKIWNEKFICNDNNMCNSCNKTIICDSNGNCKSCGTKLYLDSNNNCNSCKTPCISNTNNTKISNDTRNHLQKISTNNKDLKAEFISTNQNNNTNDTDINDNILITNSDDIGNNNNNIDTYDNTNINTDESSNLTNSKQPQYRFFYFEEDSFNPNLRYKPRFISNINYDTANNNINNYVNKLEKLYTMTADVVEANNTLANYKILILDNINETRALNDCVISGECTPTNNQVMALNNYIKDIKATVFNLRKCNGDLTNELNKISSNNTGSCKTIEIALLKSFLDILEISISSIVITPESIS